MKFRTTLRRLGRRLPEPAPDEIIVRWCDMGDAKDGGGDGDRDEEGDTFVLRPEGLDHDASPVEKKPDPTDMT